MDPPRLMVTFLLFLSHSIPCPPPPFQVRTSKAVLTADHCAAWVLADFPVYSAGFAVPKCWHENVQSCIDVPKKVCKTVTKQVCTKQPKQVCSPVTKKVCTDKIEKVCKDEQVGFTNAQGPQLCSISQRQYV